MTGGKAIGFGSLAIQCPSKESLSKAKDFYQDLGFKTISQNSVTGNTELHLFPSSEVSNQGGLNLFLEILPPSADVTNVPPVSPSIPLEDLGKTNKKIWLLLSVQSIQVRIL